MTSNVETRKAHIISVAEQNIIRKGNQRKRYQQNSEESLCMMQKRSSILKIFAYQTNFQTRETISLTQKHLLIMKQNENGERMMQKRICIL